MKLLQIASFNIIIFIIIAIKIEKINSESSKEGQEKLEEENERVKRSFVPYRTGKKVAGQVSTALDHLLFFSGYDKRIRPQVRKFSKIMPNFCQLATYLKKPLGNLKGFKRL